MCRTYKPRKPPKQECLSLEQTLEKYKVNTPTITMFLDKPLRPGSKDFTIKGARVIIKGVDMAYYDTNGDPGARYIAFNFLDKSGAQVEPRYIITHKAFESKGGVWEEKLAPRYVTIGQLMEGNGESPCEEGCRAILAYVKKNRDAARGVRRDNAIIAITKECSWLGSWKSKESTQDMYDFYLRNYNEPMPYSFLVWMCQCMGGTVVGSPDWDHKPVSKSYHLLCRQLGIKP